ncbi:MAG: oligosaccharide flippase family protein [candidate division Zixibacteria bacterium]|nr:oligosaccharide flippase family protein [candidate division Zixibacteria bacterium]
MRKSFKNLSWLVLSDGISKITRFCYILLLSSSLAVSGFGIYSYLVAFVELFLVLYDLGFNLGSLKQVASNPQSETVFIKTVCRFKLLAVILCSSLIIFVSFLIGDERNIQFLLIIYLVGYSIRSFSMLFQSLAIAHQRLKTLSMLSILENILLISGSFLVYQIAPKLENYFYYSTSLSILMFFLWFYFGFFRHRVKLDSKTVIDLNIKDIFKMSLPFFLIMLFTNIYFKIDFTMLNHMKGSTEVGLYSVGYRFFMLIMTIPWILNRNILLPKIIKEKSNTSDFATDYFPLYFRITTIVAIGICFIVSFSSTQLLIFIFGDRYGSGGLPLSIVIWSILFCTLNAYINNILIDRSPKYLAVITGTILVPTNILLNIPLITHFGAAGAATSTVVTEGMGLVAAFLICKRIGVILNFDIIKGIVLPLTSLFVVIILMIIIGNDYAVIPLFILYFLIIFMTGGFKGVPLGKIIGR